MLVYNSRWLPRARRPANLAESPCSWPNERFYLHKQGGQHLRNDVGGWLLTSTCTSPPWPPHPTTFPLTCLSRLEPFDTLLPGLAGLWPVHQAYLPSPASFWSSHEWFGKTPAESKHKLLWLVWVFSFPVILGVPFASFTRNPMQPHAVWSPCLYAIWFAYCLRAYVLQMSLKKVHRGMENTCCSYRGPGSGSLCSWLQFQGSQKPLLPSTGTGNHTVYMHTYIHVEKKTKHIK